MQTLSIDGVEVKRQEAPGSAAELAELLKEANASNSSVIPVGGQTQLHLGNTPRSADMAVLTHRLSGILEYEPDNMTVSVAAGTRLAELQETLRESNQFLPLDAPLPNRATLGGIIACNCSGPLRFRYGTARDMLIGVQMAHADGVLSKAGGKLVKNVTGYDMCKLYTGSLGTLGVLTVLTFKVQPRSESLATVLIPYDSIAGLMEDTQLFLRSDLLPDAIEAWNTNAYNSSPPDGGRIDSPWLMMIRFGEVDAAVQWQVEQLRKVSAGNRREFLRVLDTGKSEDFWDHVASARETSAAHGVGVKCSVLYQSVAQTAQLIEQAGKALDAETSIFCHAGTNVLYGRYHWSGESGEPGSPSSEAVQEALLKIRNHCSSTGGHAVVEKVPPAVKNGMDVWGYDAPALDIMRRIKQEFDPKAILNPGRFVGGI